MPVCEHSENFRMEILKLMKKLCKHTHVPDMEIKVTERTSKVGFAYISFVIVCTTGNYTRANKIIVIMICSR